MKLKGSCLRNQRSQVRILSGVPFFFYHLQAFCSPKKGPKWPPSNGSEKFLTSLRLVMYERLHSKLIPNSRRTVDVVFPRSQIAVFGRELELVCSSNRIPSLIMKFYNLIINNKLAHIE